MSFECSQRNCRAAGEQQGILRLQTIIISGLFALAGLIVSAASPARADPFVPTFHELAPGVWSAVRDDNPRFPVMGTATFVISDEGVVVFDGGGAPLMAERIIEKIRSLTDRPVTHVIISHWHGDHSFGIYRYLEEFPNVQVVSHSFTQAAMMGTRINYIDNFPTFMPKYRVTLQERLDSNKGEDGEPLPDFMRAYYQTVLADADLIHKDYNLARVTVPTITFDDKLVIRSGDRMIELLYLGDGNTAGDISMWLPGEGLVATGDTVVHPVPYAFNVPPRKWSQTMRNIKALEYKILVPGHGDIQYDTSYVDLLIETSDSIADQRDALLAQGLSEEDAMAKLDFSAFEDRFTGGSGYLAVFLEGWFIEPFRASVFKALKGIPMVTVNRDPE